MFKVFHSFKRTYTIAYSAIPTTLKCLILRIKHAGLLSELWPMIFSTNAFLVRGLKKSSGRKLIALVFGDAEFSHYFANLVCSTDYKIDGIMRTTYLSIKKIINRIEADIILVQADASLSKFLSRQGFLILPQIRFSLNISTPLEKLLLGTSRLRRRSIRKVRELKYTYEITKKKQKLDLFYHRLYLPYIYKRHGKAAKPANFLDMVQKFRKGGLLLVKLNGKYVSGILFATSGDTVSACCLGIYEGEKQLLDECSGQAALYFLIKWSKLQGFKELNYGVCKPFMNDGLFVYKKSWGMNVESCRNPRIVVGLYEN